MASRRARRPFADEVIALLDTLSQDLMADPEARAHPDVITFAFFCRRRNLDRLKAAWGEQAAHRLGRGVTFHIAPANVPINFAYSLVCGLLAGNVCVVRAPTKPFPQTAIVCRVLGRVLARDAFAPLAGDIAIVRYPRDNDVTAMFSALCDVRVIWGGDETIREIRKIPVPPRAFDLTFADRNSLCLIRAAAYLEAADPARTAQDFYNDTYLFDQNACSSPRLIVWVGTPEAIHAAKQRFWSAIHAVVQERYTLQPIIAVDKLTVVCRCAIERPDARQVAMPDRLVDRIHIDRLDLDLDRYRCAGGSFLEYDAVVAEGPAPSITEQLAAVAGIVTRKCQTLAYLGFQPEELRAWVLANRLAGIDRIVPVGRTAEFGPIWDGYDLISCLSRVCDIR
jgi:acyl-CoA reductase LuxC